MTSAIDLQQVRYFKKISHEQKIRMSPMRARVNPTAAVPAGIIVFACLLSMALALPARGAVPAQLVLIHGRILTVDPSDSIVEALAVRDGKIIGRASVVLGKANWFARGRQGRRHSGLGPEYVQHTAAATEGPEMRADARARRGGLRRNYTANGAAGRPPSPVTSAIVEA
jgi:hypothetical protein